MERTSQDLIDAVKAIRICEAQIASQREVVAELRMKAADMVEAKRQLAIKEVELALLQLRLDEVAQDFFDS